MCDLKTAVVFHKHYTLSFKLWNSEVVTKVEDGDHDDDDDDVEDEDEDEGCVAVGVDKSDAKEVQTSLNMDWQPDDWRPGDFDERPVDDLSDNGLDDEYSAKSPGEEEVMQVQLITSEYKIVSH